MKLSAKQLEAIAALKERGTSQGWASAYALGMSIGTLRALESRGLVESHYALGSMAFPRSNIYWRLTDAGKQAQQEAHA